MRQDSILLAFPMNLWVKMLPARLTLWFTLPYQSLRCTMLSSLLAFSNCLWTDQLTTGRAGFCFCFWFVLFAFWCFCLFCLFLGLWCLLFVLHGDSSMDCVSIQFSSLLSHIAIMTNVATELNEFAQCNCLFGFINDLARAIWRWTEKRTVSFKVWEPAVPCHRT